MSNSNLQKAKKAKNDCFYTRYEDVENELRHYDLSGKWVYCPFDTSKSNFWKYLRDNFNKLHLRHLTATSWYKDNEDGKGHRLDYNGMIETDRILSGDGSFDSEECTEIKDACDIVISNPPFSRFRDIIKWLNDDKG